MERYTVHCTDVDDLQETLDRMERVGVEVDVLDEAALTLQGKVDDETISAFVDLNLNIDWE